MTEELELKLIRTIDKNVEHFDFEKVHKVMKFLDWTWYNTDNQVPSISKLLITAREMLFKAGEKSLTSDEVMIVDSGGFIARSYFDKDEKKFYLHLSFAVEQTLDID